MVELVDTRGLKPLGCIAVRVRVPPEPYAILAQLVEHHSCKVNVVSSSLTDGLGGI